MTVENTAVTDALTENQPLPNGADTPAETPAEENVETGPTEDESLGTAWDRLMTNNGSDRAEDGRFKSPNGDAGDAAEGEGAGEGDGSSTVPDPTPAPANWQGLDEAWKAIPDEHKEQVKAHFDDLHRRMSDQGRQLSTVKPIADQLSQAIQKFPQFKGRSPDQLAQGAVQLAAVQAQLEQGPEQALETLLKVAQTYNVLPALTKRLSGQELSEGQNEVLELKREISGLKDQLKQVGDPSQIESHVTRAFESRAVQDQVNQFASDPANSFFKIVEPHLPQKIIEVREANPDMSPKDVLKTAYDKAVEAFPELKAAKEAAANKAAASDPKRTEAAKKAASINVKSTSTGKEKPLSEMDALGSAYDRAMAS